MLRQEDRSASPVSTTPTSAAIGRAAPSFYLDLSRLLSRARHGAPTGVDRVEMAYARELGARLGPALGYSARHPSGRMGTLAADDVTRFLADTRSIWEVGTRQSRAQVWRRLARIVPKTPDVRHDSALILASPSNLHRPARIARMRETLNARLVALVHDLIPLTHPEYARPGGARLHAIRMETLRTEAAAVVTNSEATAAALSGHWETQSHPPIHASALGIDPPARAAPHKTDRPYFLCLGTIEPRKNHLLLLNIWRHMAETLRAADIPLLIIAGRRGWENEMVLDMLDRAPAMKAHVHEAGRLGERDLAAHLRGARALLMPSFAEGFGLPVAEALAVGTPVIASNLPAHREAGGNAPDFLSPLDGEGWLAAIIDHSREGSLQRAQLTRHQGWQVPTWDRHIADVLTAAEGVLS